ncbi:MAG: hypothetical protein CXR30_00405 [Geobacter sp.]|nr:MAG: hypothetical protein CXR30_00405 [Geobacter sp.]
MSLIVHIRATGLSSIYSRFPSKKPEKTDSIVGLFILQRPFTVVHGAVTSVMAEPTAQEKSTN